MTNTTSAYDFDAFADQHRMQLVLSGIPSHLWETLHEKLAGEVFDAGNFFSMIFQNDDEEFERRASTASFANNNDQGDSKKAENQICGSASGSGCQRSKWKVLVSNQEGVLASDPSKIFLVDHSWTFKPHEARSHLTSIPGLANRMARLVELELNEDSMSADSGIEIVEKVLERLYLYSSTYTVNREDMELEDKLSVWYVLDEFGSRIRHNSSPNFRMVPFYYVPHHLLYSLLFPIHDAKYGDEVTRNFVEGTLYHRPDWMDFYLLPWFPRICTHFPIDFAKPGEEYFQTYEPINVEIVQNNTDNDSSIKSTAPESSTSKILKVYAENDQIVKFLTSQHFSLTDNKNNSDIWWLQSHFRDYSKLAFESPHVMVNQFPCESVLTVKDLLAACVHLKYGQEIVDEKNMEFQPAWFCTTFNLRTELPQFVSYYQKRDDLDLDNTWIIKPWNLARSLDIFVTNDLKQIIRMIDSGPKIACKYIEDPVLFYRSDLDAWVKFDLRFIVFLRSVRPLKCYIYNKFWLRFALKSFSLDQFDDFEKHFTVFNYLDKDKILQMTCDSFVDAFHDQNPNETWENVESGIHKCLKEVFETATYFEPPKGLASLPQCRAMYGVDVMLKWASRPTGEKYIQPVVLEVNFMPDCARACSYYPDFANTVFETLFLSDPAPTVGVTVNEL